MDKPAIIIVLSGGGNIGSIARVFNYCGYSAFPCRRPDEITALHVKTPIYVLSGVGSFDYVMTQLISDGWVHYLTAEYHDDRKIIGICLGMQLLCDGSDEGAMAGFGLIPGRFKRFDFSAPPFQQKIPHIGWNTVCFRPNRFKKLPPDSEYYFMHSYHYIAENDDHILGFTEHGYMFGSIIANKNALGIQFHPEKSHRNGIKLIQAIMDYWPLC